MEILELPAVKAARACYATEWRARHPGAPLPSLYPERPKDPSWTEANSLMEACLDRARAAEHITVYAKQPRWVALAGQMLCPNNHVVGMYETTCPYCQLVVPPEVGQHAQDLAIILGARLWISTGS